MIGLWSSLIAAYAGLSALLGGPFVGALPFAVFMASMTVMLASLVRLAFSCSQGWALAGGVAALCALFVVVDLIGAQGTNLNARVGGSATWIDGSPTAAGLVGIATTIAAIVVASLAAYVIMRLVTYLVQRLWGDAGTV